MRSSARRLSSTRCATARASRSRPVESPDSKDSWSGRRDSNPRPQPWQGCALPLSYARSRAEPRGRGWGKAAAASMGSRARQALNGDTWQGGLRYHIGAATNPLPERRDVATLGMSAAEKEALDTFKRDVVEPSMSALVILDFWAEWCGPCKQLGPVLEKVAGDYAARGVKLVKINVDEQKLIA